MGCFNVACAASGLSIGYGDEVVVIPLSMKPELYRRITREEKPGAVAVSMTDMSVYPGDRFIPVGFPIFGEYDDYGGVEIKDEDQFGYKLFNTLFDIEWDNAFRPERLVKFKNSRADGYNPDGIALGWMFIRKDIYDSIVGEGFTSWSGETYTRQGEIDAVLKMVQQGVDINIGMELGRAGKEIPEHLKQYPTIVKWYDQGNELAKLREARKEGEKDAEDKLFELLRIMGLSNFECPYEGYKDDITGETIRRPMLASTIRDGMDVVYFQAKILAQSGFNSHLPVLEDNPWFKHRLAETKWAVGFVTAMWDLSMLFGHFNQHGLQYVPAFACGQDRNDEARGKFGMTLFKAAWGKKIEDINEGYYDDEDAIKKMDDHIANIEALLAQMKADAADAKRRIEEHNAE